MKKIGIIMAGGWGKRIANFVNPKVLLKVGGKTLVEHHIEGLFNVFGVDHIILVINPKLEPLVEFSNALKEKYGEKLTIVEGVGYKNNATKYGMDLIQAFRTIRNGDLYVYVMGDHFINYKQLGKKFKKAINEELVNFYNSGDLELLLFVDKEPKCANKESLSKVLLSNSHVAKHGKHLEKWDAIEMGLIVAKRELLESIEKVVDELGDFDTTDIIEKIVFSTDNKSVGYFLVSDICWFGVNTFDDWIEGINKYIKYDLTLRETVKICKEGKAGLLSHLIYKYIAAFISFVLMKIRPKIKAESVAFFTYVFAFVMVGILFYNPLYGVITYMLLEVLDSVDGTIARTKNTCNKGGGLIDSGAGALRHTFVPILLFVYYDYFMIAFLIAFLQALKFKVRWNINATVGRVKGVARKLAEKKGSRIYLGLTGDVLMTIILIATVLEYLNWSIWIPRLPFLNYGGFFITPILLLGYFLVFVYFVFCLVDIIRLPSIGFKIYKEHINSVKNALK